MKNQGLETLAAHQGFRGGDGTNSIVRGIHPTTAYAFNDSQHAADLFNLSAAGNIYTRITNPTNDALGELVSRLEGGVGGLSTSSGMAAITATILAICKSGDHIVSSRKVYGGTSALLTNTLPSLGIETTFIDQDASVEELQKAFRPNTKLIFAESLGNPDISVLDFKKFSFLATSNKVPFVVDATFTPPCLFKPFEHGANIVIHSATKYLGGHGNAMSGVIVDGGTFEWTEEKYPQLCTPDPAYHGLVFTEAFGNAAFIYRVRTHELRDIGFCASPFDSFLVMTGIQTLGIRMDYVSKSALQVAQWLEKHPKIESVSYPLLSSHKDYILAKEYFLKGAGGILSFTVKGERADCEKFINGLELAIHATNVGDVRTIATHPASTTHRQVPTDKLAASGINPAFVRLSIGLEVTQDVINDLEQSLEKI